MSRNLARSTCCDNTLKLEDLRGKPIEFRQYFDNPPTLGTKWVCPTCETVYFAWWREAQWIEREGQYRNFIIDLSYYESFNDEHGDIEYMDKPAFLCTDNANEWQWIW